MKTAESIKTAIIEMLHAKGSGRTFKEFMEIPGFSGDTGAESATHNLFYWFNCSDEAITALKELLDENRIKLAATDWLTYEADKGIPGYPIGKDTGKYSKPHWLPVAIYKGPKFRRCS